jgi:DNA-binding PadR family transcriptional regulator
VSARNKPLRLTSTSYVVLGMIDWLGPSSPYRLERVLADTIEDFFPVPHTSFYAEPARLAGGGYLSEEQEAGGRRRKTYSLSDNGRRALEEWVEEPVTEFGQFRFPGMLKIFFGADPAAFAREQSEHHRELADKFEAARDRERGRGPELTPGRRAVANTGIELHRWWAKRWLEVAEEVAAMEKGGKG